MKCEVCRGDVAKIVHLRKLINVCSGCSSFFNNNNNKNKEYCSEVLTKHKPCRFCKTLLIQTSLVKAEKEEKRMKVRHHGGDRAAAPQPEPSQPVRPPTIILKVLRTHLNNMQHILAIHYSVHMYLQLILMLRPWRQGRADGNALGATPTSPPKMASGCGAATGCKDGRTTGRLQAKAQ